MTNSNEELKVGDVINHPLDEDFNDPHSIISHLEYAATVCGSHKPELPNLVDDVAKEAIAYIKLQRAEIERLKDQPLKWIPEVKRIEDMSAKGFLKIMRDGDGDVIVVVCAADGDMLKASESVEFCVGRGGNRSPNTVTALIKLAEAMEMDNAERPIQSAPKPEDKQS